VYLPNPNRYFLGYNLAIIEMKIEVGHGKVDSYMDTIGYYVKESLKNIATNFQAPCFVIKIIGSRMVIPGAVFAYDKVHV